MNSSFEYLMIGELCKQDRTIANSDNYLPVLSLDQIESNTGGIRYENSSKAASGDGTYFVYDEGHVLYCKLRPYLNKVALADHAGRCTTELVPLKPSSNVNARYLAYLLRSPTIVNAAIASATGARMPRTDMDALLSVKVKKFSPLEQQRIVDILDRAASIQRLRAEADAKLRELIPALFVDMFGDPASNSKQLNTVRLSDVCTVNPRFVKPTSLNEDDLVAFVPMASIDEIGGTIKKRDYRPFRKVAKGFTNFQNNDILFAKITPCMENGKATIFRDENATIGFGSTEFFVIRCGEKVRPEYIFTIIRMQAFRKLAQSSFTGTAGQQRVPRQFIENTIIPLPSLELQDVYLEAYNSFYAQINYAANSREVTDAMQMSLMNELLS